MAQCKICLSSCLSDSYTVDVVQVHDSNAIKQKTGTKNNLTNIRHSAEVPSDRRMWVEPAARDRVGEHKRLGNGERIAHYNYWVVSHMCGGVAIPSGFHGGSWKQAWWAPFKGIQEGEWAIFSLFPKLRIRRGREWIARKLSLGRLSLPSLFTSLGTPAFRVSLVRTFCES